VVDAADSRVSEGLSGSHEPTQRPSRIAAAIRFAGAFPVGALAQFASQEDVSPLDFDQSMRRSRNGRLAPEALDSRPLSRVGSSETATETLEAPNDGGPGRGRARRRAVRVVGAARAT